MVLHRKAVPLIGAVLVAFVVISVFLEPDDGNKTATLAPADPVRWTSCDSRIASAWPLECGRYYPALWPTGFQPFAVFRYPGTEKRSPLVYIAGGPGSGMQTHTDRLQAWAYWLEEAELQRDLVIYEQPGLEPGEPAWNCDEFDEINQSILLENLTAAEESQRVAPVLRQCLEDYDYWLKSSAAGFPGGARTFTSQTSARNLNSLLGELGYGRWNLWGVSYGSRVALVAAQQEPERVRTLVLDSPYPLTRGKISEKPQLYAQALERFWQYCRDHPQVCGLLEGEDPEALFWSAMQQLREAPHQVVTDNAWGGNRELLLNDHRLLALALFALYDHRLYPELVDSLRLLSESGQDSNRSLRLLVDLFLNAALDPDFNTMVFFAVECNDNPLISNDEYLAAAKNQPSLYTYIQLDRRVSPCQLPYFDPQSQLALEPTPKMPALILAGELDPVTPASWAREIARDLPGAYLHVAPATAHAVLGSGACEPPLLEAFVAAPDAGDAALASHCR